MIVVGIDPGVTGAVAVIDDDSADVFDIPAFKVSSMTMIDAIELRAMLRDLDPDIVFVEQVHANAISYKSNFALGHAIGTITTVVTLQEISMQRIQPKEWQRLTGLTSIPAKERKKAHRGRAAEMWPNLRFKLNRVADHNRADALLIAAGGLKSIKERNSVPS